MSSSSVPPSEPPRPNAPRASVFADLPDPPPIPPTTEFLDLSAAQTIAFDAGDIERLGRYLAILLAANERVNLTAIREPDSAWTRHIFDSLTLIAMLGELADGARVIDVGAGGGLPSLPLAITLPHLEFTLLEATGKKAEFLSLAIERLGLTNARVVQMRAEQAGQMRSRSATGGSPTSANVQDRTTAGSPTSAEEPRATGGSPTSANVQDRTTGDSPTSAQKPRATGGSPTSAEEPRATGGLPTSAEKPGATGGLPTSANVQDRTTGGQAATGTGGEKHNPTAHRETYDAAIARALGPIRVASELTIPLIKQHGLVLLIKGERAAAELAEAANALRELRATHAGTINTPTGKIVCLTKHSATPRMYPRRDGEPKRNPL